jgi:hypothetical protein
MKIAVMGNCQSLGFATSLRVLLPTASVERFHTARAEVDRLKSAARECDLFYIQERFSHQLDGSAGNRIRYFPLIVFTGFHPDLTWIKSNGDLLPSPVGRLHSALIAACHLRGTPAERASRLFNTYIFAELGFLGEFDRARETLVSASRKFGFDPEPMIERWLAHGCFMHTVNHPKMRVLFSIAAEMMKKEGLPVSEAEAPADNPSRVLQWPVHRVLADKIGIPASPEFRSGAQKQALPDFIAGSYRTYDSLPKSTLMNNPAVARALSDLDRAGVR